MANWTNPVLSSTYTAVLDDLKNRDIDAAVMFSPSYSTATNIAAGTVRWNPTNGYFEIYSGTAWSALIAKYMIDVDKLDGQSGAYYLAWGNLTGVPATFAPSAHTHDDRYFTETEADARFANKIIVSGNTIKLQTFGGTDLSTITVPYASAAGDAATVGGYAVGQNLNTTSGVTFASVVTTGSITAGGNSIFIGDSGDLTPGIQVWDNTNTVFRSLRWSNSVSDWQLEDATGTLRYIYHEGHKPTWSEVTGKPATFAPEAHGHTFDATNKGIVFARNNTNMNAYTGDLAELVYNSTTKRLHTHDGVTAGGNALALLSDVPAAPDLSGYALLSTNTFTGSQTMPTIRLTTTTGVSLASTGHGFQLGASTGINLVMDSNDIQVRNNGAAGAIGINALGGNVTLGGPNSVISIGDTGASITITGTLTLPASSVDTTQLVNNAVTTAKINALAVTTSKLADDAVTSAKIAANAVGGTEINLANGSQAVSTGSGSISIPLDTVAVWVSNSSISHTLRGSGTARTINYSIGDTSSGTIYWRYIV